MPEQPSDHTFAVCAYGDSPFLEECIRSLERQTLRTNVLLATPTPTPFVRGVAERHGIEVHVNDGPCSITQDWNFALDRVRTRFATVVHQDDVYEPAYAEKVLARMRAAAKPLIAFTDYGELRGDRRVFDNRLLAVKKALLLPLRPRFLSSSRWARRMALRFGDPICCPSVTFCLDNVPRPVFREGFRSCEDWEAWERLSRLDGEFLYVRGALTMHRIHEESETTKIIGDGARAAENLAMFRKFWPGPLARAINRLYNLSERSNAL